MSRRATSLSVIAGVSLAATMMAAPVAAETIDKLTYLTFNGRVQIPGAKLNAGTYRFRLANPNTGRDVIQVLSYDGSTVYGMFDTIPDSRTIATDDPTVTFRETPAGVPPAIKSLFYGGEHRGYQFIYPKGGPDMTAEILTQPEITYTAASSAPGAVIVAAEPAPEQIPPPPPVPAPAPRVVSQPAITELPHTASPVPLVALGGLASLILGLGANVIRRLVS